MTRRLEGRSKETIWPSNSSPRVVFAEITTPIANSSPPASMAAAAPVVDGGEGRGEAVWGFWEISETAVWSTPVPVKTWSRWANQLRARSFRVKWSALLVQICVLIVPGGSEPVYQPSRTVLLVSDTAKQHPVLGGKLTWRLGGRCLATAHHDRSPKPPSTTLL
jgi:hypothetical protein